jgi:hypothetical protein
MQTDKGREEAALGFKFDQQTEIRGVSPAEQCKQLKQYGCCITVVSFRNAPHCIPDLTGLESCLYEFPVLNILVNWTYLLSVRTSTVFNISFFFVYSRREHFTSM